MHDVIITAHRRNPFRHNPAFGPVLVTLQGDTPTRVDEKLLHHHVGLQVKHLPLPPRTSPLFPHVICYLGFFHFPIDWRILVVERSGKLAWGMRELVT